MEPGQEVEIRIPRKSRGPPPDDAAIAVWTKSGRRVRMLTSNSNRGVRGRLQC